MSVQETVRSFHIGTDWVNGGIKIKERGGQKGLGGGER